MWNTLKNVSYRIERGLFVLLLFDLETFKHTYGLQRNNREEDIEGIEVMETADAVTYWMGCPDPGLGALVGCTDYYCFYFLTNLP